MKKFTNYINEGCTTADVNQGNSLLKTGVTNHLTPIGNIVTNVRNLFGSHLGVVASIAEDGVSIKLNCSRFVSKDEINKTLYNYNIMKGTCLANYIQAQGLDQIKAVNVGQFFVVYFSPSDIATAEPAAEPAPANLPCKEMLDLGVYETEMISIIKESDAEEELEDVTKAKIKEIVTSKDKVKAAKQFELLISQEMELPREYYFAGVKAKTGEESIALRWKYTRRAGKNQTAEMTRSLINIYDDTKDGIFIADFDKDTMFNLPDEVRKLIENIIDFLGAEKTNDPCVYSLTELDDAEKPKDEDKDKDEDKEKNSEENKDDKSSDEKKDSESSDNDKKDDNGDVSSSDDLL